MSAAYADRLAAALAARLPGDVTVTNAQGTIVLERGNARALAPATHGGDRRAAVTERDVSDTLLKAAHRLARDVPHFRPVFDGPARELVRILREAATS